MHPAPFAAEDLIRHRAWVRALARSLVRDDASADDLAQEAWLAAVEHPPRRTDAPRSWLARVLRTRAVDAFRSSSRRNARQAAVARPEASPSAADTVAQAETHRLVVDAVMDLDEPYRTAVLLRFFEDLPPREVARRTGVRVETARTRVRRGIERLRARLAPDEDGRRRCALLVLGSVSRRAVPASAATGGLLMALTTRHVAAAVVLALVLGGAAGLAIRNGSPSSSAPPAQDPPGARATPPAAAPRVADAQTSPAPSPADPGGLDRRLHLRLRREDGGPIAGAAFALLDGHRVEMRGRMASSATIDAATSARPRRLLVRPDGCAPQCVEVGPSLRDAEIVLPAGAVVGGRVEIAGGIPGRGVRVWIQLESPVLHPEDVPEELGDPAAWTGTSFTSARVAPDGTFRVSGLMRGARGSAALPWGYDGPGALGAEFTAPREDLLLAGSRWPHVEGRLVRDVTREPVAGATVVIGGTTVHGGWSSSTRSDDDGTFGIGLRGETGPEVHLAVRDADGAPLLEQSLGGAVAEGRDLGDILVGDPWASVARLEVVDPAGVPVKGAVAVFDDDGPWCSPASDAQGLITVPLAGAHRRVLVAGPATATAEVEVGPTGGSALRVVLAPGALVRVRFGDGGPPPGALVRLLAPGRTVTAASEGWSHEVLARGLGFTAPRASVRDETTGEYLWFDARRGEPVVIGPLRSDAQYRIDAVDRAGSVLAAFDVRAEPGTSREITIPVPPLRTWRIRVEDAAGQPLEGASVEFRDALRPALAPGDEDRRATGRTGRDGRLCIDGLAAENLDVVVTAPGNVPRVLRALQLTPAAGESAERVVRLELGGRLVVRGRDPSAWAGVDTVLADPHGHERDGPFGALWEAVRTGDAEWTLDGLPPGPLEVVVLRGGRADGFRATADAGTIDVVLDPEEK